MLNFNQWVRLDESLSNGELYTQLTEILKKFIINLEDRSSIHSPTYKIEKNKLVVDTSTTIEGNDEDTYDLDIEYWIIFNITLNKDTSRLLELSLIEIQVILKSFNGYEKLTLTD